MIDIINNNYFRYNRPVQIMNNHAKHLLVLSLLFCFIYQAWNGPRQANLVLIAYASSEGSGEPAHPRSLARTFAARSYKQWIKRNLQTESQIPGPSEWLGMRSWNLSWRNARRHKFAWRGSNNLCALLSTFSFIFDNLCFIVNVSGYREIKVIF